VVSGEWSVVSAQRGGRRGCCCYALIEFFQKAEKGALSGGFVAEEVGEELLVSVDPMIGIAGQFKLDVFEPFLGTEEEPISFRRFNHQQTDEVVFSRIAIEPELHVGVECFLAFGAEDRFFRTNSMGEAILGGACLAFGCAGTCGTGSGARLLFGFGEMVGHK